MSQCPSKKDGPPEPGFVVSLTHWHADMPYIGDQRGCDSGSLRVRPRRGRARCRLRCNERPGIAELSGASSGFGWHDLAMADGDGGAVSGAVQCDSLTGHVAARAAARKFNGSLLGV